MSEPKIILVTGATGKQGYVLPPDNKSSNFPSSILFNSTLHNKTNHKEQHKI